MYITLANMQEKLREVTQCDLMATDQIQEMIGCREELDGLDERHFSLMWQAKQKSTLFCLTSLHHKNSKLDATRIDY